LSLPPDFKKKLTKIIQEQTGSRKSLDYAMPELASLESIIPGQPVAAGAGEFYLVRRELGELYSSADMLSSKYCEVFSLPWKVRADSHKLHHEFRDLLSTAPAKVMFLDAETTGLSNTPLFLLGLMHFNGESFIIDQLFARDYSEEANLLHYFSEFAPGFDTLVTFNGKSFDARFIADRMIYHRKRFRWTQNHVDILHHSRRRWKNELPDCKLQTLESHICSRRRVGDVPGALVPEVYREFVRTGDTRLLADVFHHNALDLITLVELTVVLLA
jgi:uncharacterized protein YprB with RNaseH-like and TPR domain